MLGLTALLGCSEHLIISTPTNLPTTSNLQRVPNEISKQCDPKYCICCCPRQTQAPACTMRLRSLIPILIRIATQGPSKKLPSLAKTACPADRYCMVSWLQWKSYAFQEISRIPDLSRICCFLGMVRYGRFSQSGSPLYSSIRDHIQFRHAKRKYSSIRETPE